MEVLRSVFTNNRYTGIFAIGAGTELTLSDVLVGYTLSRQSDGKGGIGLSIKEGATVEVSRTVFTNNREIGVFAADSGTELSLSDVVVGYTLSKLSDGNFGRGLTIESGASVEVSRSVFTNNRERGVVAFNEGTKLTMSDILISHTLERQCATDEREEHQPRCNSQCCRISFL